MTSGYVTLCLENLCLAGAGHCLMYASHRVDYLNGPCSVAASLSIISYKQHHNGFISGFDHYMPRGRLNFWLNALLY